MMAQTYSRFLGVIFEDRSNEVIPKRWMHSETGQDNCIKVLFPPGDVQSKAKKEERPGKSWTLHPAKVLAQSGKFKKCEKKLYDACNIMDTTATEMSSDADSSDSETTDFPGMQLVTVSNAFTPPIVRHQSQGSGSANMQPSAYEKILEDKISEVQKSLDKALKMLAAIAVSVEEGFESVIKPRELTECPNPAATMEELSNLLKFEDIKVILGSQKGYSPTDTVTKIFRRLMTREFAATFSLSGLGDKRKATKNSFKDHDVAPLIYGLLEVQHVGVPRSDLNRFISASLKSFNYVTPKKRKQKEGELEESAAKIVRPNSDANDVEVQAQDAESLPEVQETE